MKSGYHHIDIFEPHQEYLGFSWEVNGVTKYYVFCVLPFGLGSAPYIFTKVMRVLVKFWRTKGICITVYIDDGIGVDPQKDKANENSVCVSKTLDNAGFVKNSKKSHMIPCKALTWLGIFIDLDSKHLSISVSRMNSLALDLDQVLSSPHTTARKLAKIAGKINSMHYVLGNIVRLQTRSIYRTIADRHAWDNKFNYLYYHKAVDEIMFWKQNCVHLNCKPISDYEIPRFMIFSDASGSGCGSILMNDCDHYICYRSFDDTEVSNSSTWRELESIKYALLALKSKVISKALLVHTDNWATSQIVDSGSNKEHLQQIAIEIYNICKTLSMDLKT